MKAERIILHKDTIDAYRTLMTEPKNHGLEMLSLQECFEESETAIPKHILYKQYIDKVQRDVPKLIFYIVMDDIYCKQIDKAPDGNIGYKLMIKQ